MILVLMLKFLAEFVTKKQKLVLLIRTFISYFVRMIGYHNFPIVFLRR